MSDLQAVHRLIRKNQNGILLSSDSAEEAAKAVKLLFENRRLSRKMAERGRRAFFEEYNWEKVESRLLDLYKKLS